MDGRLRRGVVPREPHFDAAELVDARLEERRLWMWERDGKLVSSNMLTAAIPGIPRINGVYTPPAMRGNGYASVLVAATSQHVLDNGGAAVVLYADSDNATTNKIYQNIGYQRVGSGTDWTFVQEETGTS